MNVSLKCLVLSLTILLLQNPGGRAFAQVKKKASEELSMRRDIHRLINVKRSIYNQAALHLNDTLNAIAKSHSQAMADHKRPLGHDGFLSRDTLIRMNWSETQGTGENVTIAVDAEEAVENWWTSEGHKDTMLGDYTDTGIGLVKEGQFWYCTQIFIHR